MILPLTAAGTQKPFFPIMILSETCPFIVDIFPDHPNGIIPGVTIF